MYWLNTFFISMPLFIGAIRKKMLFPILFLMGQTRKAIAVNSRLTVAVSSLKRVKPCSVRTLPRIYQGTNEYF